MIPVNLDKIQINFARAELPEIAKAIAAEKVRWEWGSYLEFGGAGTARFRFKGKTYEMGEWFEEICSITEIGEY